MSKSVSYGTNGGQRPPQPASSYNVDIYNSSIKLLKVVFWLLFLIIDWSTECGRLTWKIGKNNISFKFQVSLPHSILRKLISRNSFQTGKEFPCCNTDLRQRNWHFFVKSKQTLIIRKCSCAVWQDITWNQLDCKITYYSTIFTDV